MSSKDVQRLLDEPAKEPWWRDESGPRNPFAPGGKVVFTAAATKVKTFAVVQGSMDFPVDMLRYDRAFCLTPIPHPRHPWFGRIYRVVVGFEDKYKPTVARWHSFGWKVTSVQPTAKQVRCLQWRAVRWLDSCHRCACDTSAYAMSWFHPWLLLCPACEEEERGHPDFEVARATLRRAYATGEFNSPGVLWPGLDGRLP